MRYFLLFFSLFFSCFNSLFSQSSASSENKVAVVSGVLTLDQSWERQIYLSHIANFDRKYEISNQMIVSKAEIDSNGYFKFEIDFLPSNFQLYRIHLVKKGDSQASLIIGGKNENHLFIALNNTTQITLKNDTTLPPFKQLHSEGSAENKAFLHIQKMVEELDFKASMSTASARALIQEQLMQALLQTADTSTFEFNALYAIYLHQSMSNWEKEEYAVLLDKWGDTNNPYFLNSTPITIRANPNLLYLIVSISIIMLVGIAWFLLIFQKGKKHPNKLLINELSVQERRVFSLLKSGKSNQEISEECNIAVSTVKTHVSNIYGKLNISSRKEAMNFEE